MRKFRLTSKVSTEQAIKVLVAIYLLLFVLAQLFSFEKFPGQLAGIGLLSWLAPFLAVVLVVSEVMALPYLLYMRLREAWVRVSFWSGIVALSILTALEIMAFRAGESVLFGTSLGLPGGSWSLLLLAGVWTLWLWGVFGAATQRTQKKK